MLDFGQLAHVNPQSLRKLLDIFSQNFTCKIGYQSDNWDYFMLNHLLKRLNTFTVKAFQLNHGSNILPSYQELRDLLIKQFASLESFVSQSESVLT